MADGKVGSDEHQYKLSVQHLLHLERGRDSHLQGKGEGEGQGGGRGGRGGRGEGERMGRALTPTVRKADLLIV